MKTSMPRIPRRAPTKSGQRGAVLYIALIMLVLLAMIGIVGMQVAGLQERMSSNYRATNLAFQNAEGAVRNAECAIENIENRTAVGGCTVISADDISRRCDDGYQARAWARTQTFANSPAVNIRQIDQCIQGQAPLDLGGPAQANPFPVYQVTGYSADDAGNPTSASTVDTIFKL